MLSSWWARRWRRAIRGTHKRRVRPALEALEPRWLPSTIYVTDTNDSGIGSLRDAITTANGSPGTVIDFAIGSGGQATIIPASALPTIAADGTVIDGTTQTGYSGSPLIVLAGASSGQASYDGLTITAANCTINGLAITRFNNGLTIQTSSATGNVVKNCYIGTDAAGTTAEPNAGQGVQLLAGASNNILGPGDVVSGNLLNGVLIDALDASGNKVTTSGNVIEGDFIGTTPDGLSPLGNHHRGIAIRGGTSNTVGGSSVANRNIVSANGISTIGGYSGIVLGLNACDYNVIEGNYIGVDANGNASVAMENSGAGIECGANANYNTIGGTASNAGNLIGPNGRFGSNPAPNGVGVNDLDPATGKFLGKFAGFGNTILGNQIYDNPAGTNGIALSTDGGNDDQAAPVLQTAFTSTGGVTTVKGALTSTPNTQFVLEFFASSTNSPPQGDIFLGRSSLTNPLRTDASGQLSFTVPGLAAVPVGDYVTATATNLTATATTHVGDTSEFSAAIADIPPARLTFAVQPTGTTTGAAISPAVTVQLLDQNGNLCTDDNTDQVTLTVASGPSGFAAGSTTTVTASGGVASFTNLILTTAGSYTLGETATGGITGPDSASFAIQIGSVSLAQSVVSVSPGSIVAGTTATVTLQAKDAYGNDETGGGLAVQFGLGAGLGQGTFGAVSDNHDGTYTAVLTGTTAGSNTITATIGGQAVTSTAPTFTVTPGTLSLSQSTVSVAPTSIPLNATATVTLQTKDAYGNDETTSGLIVQFGLGTGTGQGTFGSVQDNQDGTYTATFTGTVADSNTITATINGQDVTSIPPTVIIVGPVDLSQSTVTVSPAGITAGGTSTVTLHARDAYGHAETVGGLTVTFGLGTGVGQSTIGSVTDNNDGTYTALFTGTVAGSNTVTATIGGQPVTTAAPTVTITSAPATRLVLQMPSQGVVGGRFTATILAEDLYGNTDPTYSGLATVIATTAPAGGTLVGGAPVSFQAGVASLADLWLNRPGGYVLLAAGDNILVGTTAPITVVARTSTGTTTTHLVVTGAGSPIGAGGTVTIVVTAETAKNGTDGLFPDTIHFSSSDRSVLLPPDYTFQPTADNGTHTFTITLRTAGSQTISVSDLTWPTIPKVTTPRISVTPGPLASLAVSGYPTTTISGSTHSFTVTAVDAYGNRLTNYQGVVGFSSTDKLATLPSAYGFGPSDGGAHKFTATLYSLGGASLSATDLSASTIGGTGNTTVVSPATHLAIAGLPSAVTAGEPLVITVTALTPGGKADTLFSDTIHVASNDPQFVPFDYTFQPGVGSAQLYVKLNTPGKDTITVTDLTRPAIQAASVWRTLVGTPPAMTVGMSGPTTGVRGQPLGFTLTATETGAPASTVFTYRISWGAGAVQVVSGPSGLVVNHVYPADGAVTPRVTVVDPAGNVGPSAAASAVTIQAVALEADPLDGAETALVIGGTPGKDVITIQPVNGDPTGRTVQVLLNGVPLGPFTPTGHILVYGQAGNDTIQELANGSVPVAVPALLFGGSVNDTLSVAGSSAANVLVGGTGRSTLWGGSGPDILIGGGGPAVLHAGSGGDILIGGRSTFDANLPALLALTAEWGSGDSYAQRVQALFGNGSGGLNGSTFLDTQTVAQGATRSQLIGGAGPDWFWFGAGATVVDTISNYRAGDVATFD